MKSQRSYIDYSLDKRATLAALFRGTVNACDADPYLMRAAKFHGVRTTRPCPVCKHVSMVELMYTFAEELRQMEKEYGEFRVYIVEVCRDCSWNHLCVSFVLGDGVERKPPRYTRTLEDSDWA
jgi:hypothetical protein